MPIKILSEFTHFLSFKMSRKVEFISVQARGGLIQSRGAYNQVYFSFCLLSNRGSIFTAVTCISHVPSLLKSKFQKDYQQEIICEHFCFQSACFVYTKVNKSHPMHGVVVFNFEECLLTKGS